MIEQIFINIFKYTPVHNIIFGIISGVLAFLVAYRANKIYHKTSDKRMAIIAAGFVLGGLFEVTHAINSYTKGILYYYVFFRNLSFTGSIFISLFLSKNDTCGKNNNFEKKVLTVSFIYFLLVVIFQKLINPVILEQSIPYVSIQIVFTALYFLLSLLYMDIRLNYKLKPLSPLIIGLFIYSLSELYVITPDFLSSWYRFIIHLEDILGLLFIYWGIKDFYLKKNPLNSRQKLLIFSSAILLVFYWIMILSELIIFNLQIPIYFKYYIFIFFITTVIIQYILSIKIAGPIDRTVKSIKTTFIITTLLIITIILVVHSFISLYVFKVYTENQTRDYLKSTIENESNKFYSDIKNVETINLISSKILNNFSVESLSPIIRDNFKLNPLIFGSGVFLEPNVYASGIKYYGPYWYKDKNGNIKFTWVYSTPEYNYLRYDWYKNGFIPKTDIVWNEPNIDDIAKIAIMSVTSPIRKNNSTAGVFVTDVKLSSFQNYVADIKIGKKGYAFLVSDQGYYVSDVKSKKILQDKITVDKNIEWKQIGKKVIKADKTEIFRTIIDNIDIFVVYTPIGNTKIKLVFILPAEEIYAYINKRLAINIMLLFASIILFSIIFTLLFAKTLVTPLDNLIQTVDKVAKGDLSVRTSVKTKDEIALFADSLNYMIESLQDLVDKERQNKEKQILLRTLVSTIRSTLDINEIKSTFVNEIGKFFKADRTVFAEFDPQKNIFLPVDKYSEYLRDPDQKSLIGYDWSFSVSQAFIQLLKEQREINIQNLDNYLKEHNLENTDFGKFFKELNIKSSYDTIITYGNEIMGFFCINYLSDYFEISNEDIEFLRIIANQAGIAIHQAKLYEITKMQADREALLRKIIETIRSSLDIDETLNIICDEVAKLFNVQRATIVQFPNPENYEEYIIRREYKISPEVKGLTNPEYIQKTAIYWAQQTLKGDKKLLIDNIPESDTPDYFKESYNAIGVKSVLGFPIKKGNNAWGTFVLSEYNYYRHWTSEEAQLLETIAGQVYTAIRQAELFLTTKGQTERENSLRRIISKIGSSLDINEIKTTFVTEIGKTLNSDLNAFYQIDQKSKLFLPVDEYSVYRSSPDIKNLVGLSLEEYGYGDFFRKQEKEIIISNTEDFKREYNVYGDVKERFINEFNVKSAILVPVKYGKELLGIFTINFIKDYRNITEDDANFVKALASQAGIAIYQAKLYDREKQTAERESILRNISNKIGSSLDLAQVKHEIVTQVGTFLKADRVFFADYSFETNKYLVSKEGEYRSSENIRSFIGYDFTKEPGFIEYVRNIHLKGKDIIFSDIEKYLDESNLRGTGVEKFYKEYGYAASAAINIYYGNIFLGDLVITFEYYRDFSDDEIKFLKALVDQSGVAIYQSQLYNKEKQTAGRERLLREIISIIRSSLDVNETKSRLVKEIGIAFNADRVFIVEYDPETNIPLVLDKYSEYLSDPNMKSFVGINFSSSKVKFFANTHKQKKPVVITDIDQFIKDNNIENTEEEKLLKEANIKSGIGIVITYGNKFLGEISIHYEKPEKITNEQVEFLQAIGDQAGIALYQAKLYCKEKQTAEREALLRKVVETMRSSLDIDEILTIICDEVGKLFNVERATIIDLSNIRNYGDYTVRREYKTSPEIKGLGDTEFDKKTAAYWTEKTFTEKKSIAIDNILTSDTPDYFKDTYKALGIKSMLAVPIKKDNIMWGNFLLSEYNYYRHWTEDDVKLLETISDQVYIAIEQAELYSATKEYAERERALREIVTIIRSTLDFNEIKKNVVRETGKLFHADRCYFRVFDKKNNTFVSPDVEYLSSPDIKSLINVKPDQEGLTYFLKELGKNKNGSYPIETNEELAKGTPAEKYLKDRSIKTDFALFMWETEEEIVYLVLHYIKEKPHITEEDKKLMETVAKQISIAFDQSRLYESVKQTAEKERLLREIISEIKIFQTFDQAYNYILEKITEIFDIDRAIFVEVPVFVYEKPTIKYEYLRNKNLSPIKDKQLPVPCQQMFIEISNNFNTFIVNDIAEYHTELEESQQFFRDNHVKSFIAAPFVKYDKEIKFFGILVLCSTKTRIWSSKETELLKSIIESTVIILWEILKFNEINELRNTFILTLAHDLQVPLVGEKRALEFLETRPDGQPIGKFKEFISETLKSNQNLFNLLTKLLESYYYESGKKQLNFVGFNMKSAINQVVDKLKESAQSKSVKINVEIEKDLPDLNLDRDEIEEALYYLLENAITYTQSGGQVIIKSYIIKDEIITCVSDNGPGIEPAIQERIFKRYEMAQAIERKIGSGLSLYLAKQIIEAHKGRIWYETESGVGTIFCFVLPVHIYV